MVLLRAHLFLVGYALMGVVSIVFMITSLQENHWIKIKHDKVTANAGLFKICYCYGGNLEKCFNYDDSDLNGFDLSRRTAAAVLSICAIICCAATIVVMGHMLCGQRVDVGSRLHGFITLCVFLLAAILTFSAVGTFTNKNNDNLHLKQVEWHYDYSLYLAAFSGMFFVIAGVFSVATAHYRLVSATY